MFNKVFFFEPMKTHNEPNVILISPISLMFNFEKIPLFFTDLQRSIAQSIYSLTDYTSFNIIDNKLCSIFRKENNRKINVNTFQILGEFGKFV